MNYRERVKLLRKYLLGKTTEQERAKVDNWYDSFKGDGAVKDSDKANLPVIKEQLYKRIQDELQGKTTVIPFYRKPFFRVAAILILAFGGFYLSRYGNSFKKEYVQRGIGQLKKDVAPPSSNKAVLTLADGSKIELDSSGKGTLAIQGRVKVIKQDDGQIAYNGNSTPSAEISYNTLTVPRGSKPTKLLLQDGSQVWLNVASSITYPTAFSGNERSVEITGEAYFEIAKNPSKPFIVKKKDEDLNITVLGTHFNVNAYDDERTLAVTLLEGSVDVSKGKYREILTPGQQAQLNNQLLKVANEVDLEEVMAWKNGRFYFDGADIKTVMRQVEKWYNVEVNYEDTIPYSFVAKISRNVNVSELLKIIALTDLVHFNIENNKITVMK